MKPKVPARFVYEGQTLHRDGRGSAHRRPMSNRGWQLGHPQRGGAFIDPAELKEEKPNA